MKNSTKKGKKIFLLFFLIILIAAICAVVYILFGNREEQVQENLELGQKYLSEMDYEEAIVAYNKVINLDKKNQEAYTSLGELYLLTEEYASAIHTLKQGIKYIDDPALSAQLETVIIKVEEARKAEEEAVYDTPVAKKTMDLVYGKKTQTVLLNGFLNEEIPLTDAVFNTGEGNVVTPKHLLQFNIDSIDDVLSIVSLSTAAKVTPILMGVSKDNSTLNAILTDFMNYISTMSYKDVLMCISELEAKKERTQDEDIKYGIMLLLEDYLRSYTKESITQNVPEDILQEQYWWVLE